MRSFENTHSLFFKTLTKTLTTEENEMTNLETINAMIANGQMDDSALECIVESQKERLWIHAIADTANEFHSMMTTTNSFWTEDRINDEMHELMMSEKLGFFYGGVQDPKCELKTIEIKASENNPFEDNTDKAMDTWCAWLAHFQKAVVNHMIASDKFETQFETKGYMEFSYKIKAK